MSRFISKMPLHVPRKFFSGALADGAAMLSPMDMPRKRLALWRRGRFWLWIFAGLLAAGCALLLIVPLRPALPSVDRSSVWIDTVKEGPLVREARGLGTMVPEDVRWIAAWTEARVEQIVVWPGAEVQPDTVLLVLRNDELRQSVMDADASVRSSEAKLVCLKAQLQGQSLEREAALTKVEGERDAAAAQLEVDERLARQGLIATIDLKKSAITARELTSSSAIERQRFEFTRESVQPQLAVAEAELEQVKAQASLRHSQADDLQVRAGMSGVLQQIPVEVGQNISAGTNVARVANPAKLKAQIKIPEAQARDITIGQPATIDTRTSGLIAGHVSRIDPAVQQGTVLVDVRFHERALPRGARPDLGVEGIIQLERLENVVYVGRPAFGQDESTISLFKLTPDGTDAQRTRVGLGRGSVNAIEIRSGLRPGDRVILSDPSAYDNHDWIRLN